MRKMFDETIDGVFVKQVGVKFQRAAEMIAFFQHEQGQIEFGGFAVRFHRFQLQFGMDGLHGLCAACLQGKHDLKNGRMTQITFRLQCVHQLFER